MLSKYNIVLVIIVLCVSVLFAQEKGQLNEVRVDQQGDFIVIDQDDQLLLENNLHNKSDFSIKLTKDQLKELRAQEEEISDLSFSKNRYNNNIPNLDQIKQALNRSGTPNRSQLIEKSFTNVVVVSNIPPKPMDPIVSSNINHYYHHYNTNKLSETNDALPPVESPQPKEEEDFKTNKIEEEEDLKDKKLTDDEIAYYLLAANEEFKKKKYQEVLEILNFIEENAPKNYDSRHNVFLMKGTIYYKLGLYNQARRYWYYSLKLNPNQPKLKYAMHKINKIVAGKK